MKLYQFHEGDTVADYLFYLSYFDNNRHNVIFKNTMSVDGNNSQIDYDGIDCWCKTYPDVFNFIVKV